MQYMQVIRKLNISLINELYLFPNLQTCYLLICYDAVQIRPLIFTIDLHLLLCNLLCACAVQTRVLLAAVHTDTSVP
jgi:hypothetical protein